MRQKIIFSVLLISQLFMVYANAQDERSSDHEALRGLLKTAKEAILSKKLDSLGPVLSETNLVIVTVDNQKFTSFEGFKNYWSTLFEGEKALLKDIQIDPKAEGKTTFLTDSVGVVDGTSMDTYHFKDGDTRSMNIRWTATVQKENNTWKIVTIHFSTDFLDNPVTQTLQDKLKQYTLYSGILGLILGALIVAIIKRRKTS